MEIIPIPKEDFIVSLPDSTPKEIEKFRKIFKKTYNREVLFTNNKITFPKVKFFDKVKYKLENYRHIKYFLSLCLLMGLLLFLFLAEYFNLFKLSKILSVALYLYMVVFIIWMVIKARKMDRKLNN